jgi:L-fuculose-phosphate aldolase
MADVCHRLYDRGLVTATDGNVSARLPGGGFVATRSGVNKGMVTGKDLVRLTAEGEPESKGKRPSTELDMHLFIYRMRPDVNAVVHAHPPYATAFAAAGVALDQPVLPEILVTFGTIPLAPYATPSTPDVAQSIAPFVGTHTAILLANHGVVTYGSDLIDAYFRMEKVEHAATIIFRAGLLGGVRNLTGEELNRLRDASRRNYGKDIST